MEFQLYRSNGQKKMCTKNRCLFRKIVFLRFAKLLASKSTLAEPVYVNHYAKSKQRKQDKGSCVWLNLHDSSNGEIL